MEYFISDLHFNHDNILKFERQEFKTIEEHNEFIIASINRVVTKFDTLYLLGDLGDDLELIKRLNGKKIWCVLRGNISKQNEKSDGMQINLFYIIIQAQQSKLNRGTPYF